MKRIAPLIAIVLSITTLLCGCATLFANKTPEVRINSDPNGAKVYVNGNLMGTTPLKLNLAANKTYTIEF